MTPLPILVPPGFRIIAHRGASGYAPENTVAAFTLARKMGAREVELDVQFSKDRHLVICHDRTLDRYGYPGLKVAELTKDELLSLDMGAWFSPYLYGGERMLTLEALLSHFQNQFTYHVEIKDPVPGIEQALLERIVHSGQKERVIVTSKHYESLATLKSLAPNMRIGWLVKEPGWSEVHIKQAAAIECFQVCPRAAETKKELVAFAHTRVSEVRAYGILNIADAIQTIEAGCDGLTINWPDWLIHADTP